MRNTRHPVICLTGIGLAGFLLLSMPTMAEETKGGFTANTTITLALEESSIDRYEWWLLHGFQYEIEGTISISGGSGVNAGASNKIMLYGDRTEPRLSGESDWQMTPRPDNIYFTPSQSTDIYFFPFGPVYSNPNEMMEWTQTYLYTAILKVETGGSRSGSDSVAVADSM